MNIPKKSQFSNKFGSINKDTIIIKNGADKKKIEVSNIKTVNLVKQRVFYTNFVFFITSVLSVACFYAFLENSFIAKIGMILLAAVTLFYAIIHEFYFYKLVVKLKNSENYTLKTTQLDRNAIKDLYYEIVQNVKKQEILIFMSTIESA